VEKKCKILSNVGDDGHDVFTVPVSTVPSESCFSSVNRILSDKRSKLGAYVFERLVCLKDWIDVDERNQYRDQPQSSGVEIEESGTEPRPDDNSDSDGARRERAMVHECELLDR
jgi:hAT family C-terminal dimerisation region